MTTVHVTCHKPGGGLHSLPRGTSQIITHKVFDEEKNRTVDRPKPHTMQEYLLLALDGEHAAHGHSHRVIVPEEVVTG